MNDLELFREELAYCDEKIVDALNERYKIVEKIMKYKEEYGIPILQPFQGEKRNKRIADKIENNCYKNEITEVFRLIEQNSRMIQGRNLFDYNIALIGFMGAGKSTVAEYMNSIFSMDIIEMDKMIEERECMKISEIFEEKGEEYFRNLETQLLVEMQARKNAIISCGGGVAMRECNVEAIKKNGRIVLLTASPETILGRVKDNNDRPLLSGNMNVEYIQQLMEMRRPKYEAAADIVVNTDDKSVLQICEELIEKLLEMDEQNV